MKTKLALVVCAAGLLLAAGCGTVGTALRSPGMVRLEVSTVATLSLRNNPRYVPIAKALAASVDAALLGATTITPEGLEAWARGVCERAKCDPADVPLFVGLARGVYEAYREDHPGPIVTTSDGVKRYAAAFRDALRDAVWAVETAPRKEGAP